jgi:hypothetical protein
MAERVTMNGLNWLYSFERAKHIGGKAAYDTMQPVYVSIDFNNNPFTAILPTEAETLRASNTFTTSMKLR